MIPPLASFWVVFFFFFPCPPALFSPGNRRLSPRRFIGQLSYILHMCVGVCMCVCVCVCALHSFGQVPNVLGRTERICRRFCRYLLHTSYINLLHLDAIAGDHDNFMQYLPFFFFFCSFSFLFHLYLNLEGITNNSKKQTLLKTVTFKSKVAGKRSCWVRVSVVKALQDDAAEEMLGIKSSLGRVEKLLWVARIWITDYLRNFFRENVWTLSTTGVQSSCSEDAALHAASNTHRLSISITWFDQHLHELRLTN